MSGMGIAAPPPSNREGELLASAQRTANTTQAGPTNRHYKGVTIFLDVTAASGTGGLQVFVEEQDPSSGEWDPINATPPAITATGTTVYRMYPGLNASNVGNAIKQAISQMLGKTWRVRVAHGDGSNYTYSVGYTLHL